MRATERCVPFGIETRLQLSGSRWGCTPGAHRGEWRTVEAGPNERDREGQSPPGLVMPIAVGSLGGRRNRSRLPRLVDQGRRKDVAEQSRRTVSSQGLVAPGGALACFADANRPSVHVVSVHLRDRVLGGVVISKFDEAEPARATAFAVHNDVNVVHRVSASLKGLAQAVGSGIPGKVADEES